MKRLFGIILAAFLFLAAMPANAAFAADDDGAKTFKANCAACHALGSNRVNAEKTLKKDDLVKWDMYDHDAIVNQVTNGKNAMPAFGSKLSADEIDTVADYVLAQADAGWPRLARRRSRRRTRCF